MDVGEVGGGGGGAKRVWELGSGRDNSATSESFSRLFRSARKI